MDHYSGIKTFVIITMGQSVSLIGSALTRFALGVWVIEQSGSTTLFAMLQFTASIPGLVTSPIMGALVDRWDKRRTLIMTDTGAAIATVIIAVLVYLDAFKIWHLYPLVALGAFSGSLQWPTFASVTTLLIPKKHLPRANAISQMSDAIIRICVPTMAGYLLGYIFLQGIITIDFITFIFAVSTLFFVRFPKPPVSNKKITSKKKNLIKESIESWKYITDRLGLKSLMIYYIFTNLIGGLFGVLITPYILTFSSVKELGIIGSCAGVGLLLGGTYMLKSGGPKRLINGIFAAQVTGGLCILIDGIFPSFFVLAVNGVIGSFGVTVMMGCSQSLWQRKVAFAIQGRVFALRRMVATSSLPIAYLIAGPLADFIFEPMMSANGFFADTFVSIIGLGKGRGIGLIFILLGAFKIFIAVLAISYPRIRLIEDELPDANES